MTAPLALFVRLGWRNLWRHRRRNGLLVVAILVGVAAVVLTNALIRGYQQDMRDDAVNGLNGHLKALAPGYLDDPTVANSFALAPGWQPPFGAEATWTSRIRVAAVVMSERETRGVQLVGVDPVRERGLSFLGDVPVIGEPLADAADRRVLLGTALLEELDTAVGRRIVVIAEGADGRSREAGFRVAGAFDAPGSGLEKAYAFTGRESLQALLGTARVTEVSVRFAREPAEPGAREALAGSLPGLDVRDWRALDPMAAAMFAMADAGVLIWLVIILTALGFGLVNALATAVMERVREFGMLRALGMRRSHVVLQVLVEALVVTLAGVAGGVAAGACLALGLAGGIDLSAWSAGVELAGLRSVLVPRLQPSDVLIVVAFAVLLAVLGSLYPAWRAVRIEPLDALRGAR